MCDEEQDDPRPRLSWRRALLLAAVWTIPYAACWWLGVMENFSPFLLVIGVQFTLPIAAPATLVILRGWRILPWLAGGALLLVLLGAYYRMTEFRTMSMSAGNMSLAAAVVAGHGAAWAGAWGASLLSVFSLRWFPAVGWASVALVETFALVVLLSMMRA